MTFFAVLAFALSAPAIAQDFRTIDKKAEFVKAVRGKTLTRFGITLNVSTEGQIDGRAFGRPVSGGWAWKGGFFCRDLYWGERGLGYNCQRVKLNGRTIRFISDRGAGMYADLKLK
ncbi:MAG: dihydrodipicolinate reductase [Pseudomonadota bacterium]